MRKSADFVAWNVCRAGLRDRNDCGGFGDVFCFCLGAWVFLFVVWLCLLFALAVVVIYFDWFLFAEAWLLLAMLQV